MDDGVPQRAAIENIEKVLKAADSCLNDIIKVNIYLTNMDRDFQPMNEVYIQVRTYLLQ